jgi:uncharacterized protein (DUF362 family)
MCLSKSYYWRGICIQLIEMSRVSIVKSPDKPGEEQVYAMVKKSVDLIGGIGSVVKPGQTVALKPNVVTGRVTAPGVTTDKRVVKAMIRLCQEAGAGKVLVVEGAGYFTETAKALELSGIKEMAEAMGAEVVDVDVSELVTLKVPRHLITDEVRVSKSFMDADVRINLPVMKTHDQLLVTLGVKNMKGVMPKPMKRRFHAIGVVKGIIDLNKTVPLDLTVLDAIVAMEGLGPSFGPKVELNTVVASKDVWALDRVASRMMGFEPQELDYLVEAEAHGLIDLGETIEVVGEPLSSYTYRFERPPTDLEFAEGITVISEGACSACRGTIHSVVYDLEQMKKMGEIRDLFIIVGSNAEVPDNLPNTPIIMGTCLKKYENQGCYVEGCPPNNDKMIEAVRLICKF